jgi:DNA-binding CsgD family transcriptional regulator/tetratricopeptide (TPR) repeat protein
MDHFSAAQRDVVSALAVTGAADGSLLETVSGQSPNTVRAAVAEAIDAGLLETVAGRVDFRHAVVADAIRDNTLSDVLHEMHARAAGFLAATARDDSGLERVAAHLAAIGDTDGAVRALVEAARISLAAHALLRAESLATRARELATAASVVGAADDALAAVLAAQGRWAEALELDQATARRAPFSEDRWIRMARSALDARLHDVVQELAGEAKELGRDRSPFFDVTVGRLACATGDTATALECAGRALAAAEADASIACAALDLQARTLDLLGRRDDAAAAWTRQQDLANAAGLIAEQMRGLVCLAELELFQGQPPKRMYEAVDVARQAGAVVEQVWAQLNLSIALSVQGDPRAGAELADDTEDLCRRHRLDLLPYVLVARLGAAHILGELSFERLIDQVLDLGRGSADSVLHACGIAGDHHLHLGEWDQAAVQLRRATDTMVANPGGIPVDSASWLTLALCAAGRLEEAQDALEVARTFPAAGRWYGSAVSLAVAEAVLAGDAEAVDAALASATGRMPFDLALLRVIAAEVLGGPSRQRWLREALDLYEAHDGYLAVDRVRSLLRQAGGVTPRRRRRKESVPAELIPFGVTAREAQVLGLVAEGASNGAIAERLFLSIRTVESHVSSLLTKLGGTTRAELATRWPEMTSTPCQTPET